MAYRKRFSLHKMKGQAQTGFTQEHVLPQQKIVQTQTLQSTIRSKRKEKNFILCQMYLAQLSKQLSQILQKERTVYF